MVLKNLLNGSLKIIIIVENKIILIFIFCETNTLNNREIIDNLIFIY